MPKRAPAGRSPPCAPEVAAVEPVAACAEPAHRRPPGSATALGDTLRAARFARGLSQLELAADAGISQRHVAFIEVGRAKPSRALLLRLLDQLGANPSLRNAALFHGGYLSEGLAHGPAAEQLDGAVRALVDAHFPFPAVVFDAEWYARIVSPGAWWLGSMVMPLVWNPEAGPIDMIAAIASPDGILSTVRQPERIASALLAQIEAESLASTAIRGRYAACAAELETRYGPLPTVGPESPSLTMTFDSAQGALSFFSVQMVLGFPHNISVDSLRIELSFPADAKTREAMTRDVQRATQTPFPIYDLSPTGHGGDAAGRSGPAPLGR